MKKAQSLQKSLLENIKKPFVYTNGSKVFLLIFTKITSNAN